MLWFNRVILASCPLDFIGRAFSALLPELVYFSAFLFQPLGGSQRQLQSCWLQCGKHLLADKGIQAGTGHVLAARLAIAVMPLHAFVRMQTRFAIVVIHPQTGATAGTDDQAGQERWSPAHRPPRLSAGTVVLQADLVALILLR